ncbi:hypothetical protein BJX66DRAFT_316579 [Aspergillus keveii]|uniref:Flavin-binding monooxygenase n=1 Tax=Aspergillus keveii TaxID=714993 RepID=A0ABR4FMI6_9EURO
MGFPALVHYLLLIKGDYGPKSKGEDIATEAQTQGDSTRGNNTVAHDGSSSSQSTDRLGDSHSHFHPQWKWKWNWNWTWYWTYGGTGAGATAFQLEEHPIDQVRPIKVGVIGAGLSGITAGVLLPAKLPGLDLRIYDKNSDVVCSLLKYYLFMRTSKKEDEADKCMQGGTWFENTYPGVRCDIPAHVYQSNFEPNTRWTEEFAQGAEIRDYWQGIARKYDVYKYIRAQHKVERAEWVPNKGKWKVTVRDLKKDEEYEEELDVVLNAIGHFNAWKLPAYPGIHDFKGPLFHSSNWDHSVDLKGKRVALIGNGASGLQVLPSIQPIAAHVDHYARNRTWIADSFGTVGVRRLEPNLIPPETIDSFNDADTYLAYRKKIESGYFSRFGAIFRGSEENTGLREKWSELMLRRVTGKPELAEKIIPDFPPNCRRPTPGPGYLYHHERRR